jgi:hypothetical protein
MIRLHLLGFTHDLKGFVFSGRRGGKTGTYWVPVDETLLRALEQLEGAREERSGEGKAKGGSAELDRLAVIDTQDLPLPPPRKSEPRSKLSPREIQQLLREGRSVKDVAGQAGVDASWVERFLGPIMEEQAGVIRLTQQGVQSRPRLGPSGLQIGAAVVRNLESKKATDQTLEELEDGWEARRIRPRTWRVRLRFTHRGKRRTAEWEFRKDTGAVRVRNQLASDLGWWPPPEPPQRGKGKGAPKPAAKGKTTKGGAKSKRKRPSKAAKRTSSRRRASSGGSRAR